MSMSAGVTFMDWESGQSLDELLADADRKMYERKRERIPEVPLRPSSVAIKG
jgi:PleD family two-component response regulator